LATSPPVLRAQPAVDLSLKLPGEHVTAAPVVGSESSEHRNAITPAIRSGDPYAIRTTASPRAASRPAVIATWWPKFRENRRRRRRASSLRRST